MAEDHTVSQHREHSSEEREWAFKSLEWTLYIGLSIVSVWFASEDLQQFFSHKTNFLQYGEKVTQYPVVTIELSHNEFDEPKTEDVFIVYETDGMHNPKNLTIGENIWLNEHYNTTERVILDSVQQFKRNIHWIFHNWHCFIPTLVSHHEKTHFP